MDQSTETTIPAEKISVQKGTEPNTVIFRGEDGVTHTIKLPEGPMRAAAPNNMEYEDNNGVKHSIYLPQGTVDEAWDHLENERWDELAKFAPYTNQGCTEDDFKKFAELQAKKYPKPSSIKAQPE
ncbi:hypothetical protein ONZ43_g6715 [Nemania bipapillata]|uniref:Uncharacterized protein n=1 Tax=Nemania bipapillata TaxID=110536 RepID=A0ACC2HXF1_9PEZI|nr:hypothetical protein ONZ43_g6715 [Nemania bipapillata]